MRNSQLISYNNTKTTNFLPYLSPEERKMHAFIAIGDTLPGNYYQGLHDSHAPDPPDVAPNR